MSRTAHHHNRESRQRLRDRFSAAQMIDSIGDGILALDAAGNIIAANPAAVAVLGWKEGELAENVWHAVLQPAASEAETASESPIAQTLRDGKTRRVSDETFSRKDGAAVSVEYVCAPIRESFHAEISGAVVTFREISGRVQTETEERVPRDHGKGSPTPPDVRLRQLADSMPITIWMATPDGQVDYVSRRFLEFAGFSSEQALEGWESAIHPDDLGPFLETWRESVETENRFEQECRLRRKSDGAYLWFRMEAVPVRDAAGRMLKWHGSAINIHATRELERQARQLAERLTVTFESITDGVLLLDREWRVTFMNVEAEKLLERRREELLGVNLWKAFPAAANLKFFTEYHRALTETTTVAFEEYEPTFKKWFYVKAYPSAEGLTAYFQDVTEHRHASNALKFSEERFRLLSKATNDVIWDWDKRTGATWISDGFERLFGHPRSEGPLDLESWSANIHPDERDVVTASLTRALDSDASEWSCEYRFLRSDGTYAWVVSRANIMRNEAGEVVRMLGGITDITQRRLHEEKVGQQAALLDKAQDAIIVRDLDHRIRYWNKRAERLYGWSAAEAIGQPIRTLLYRSDQRFIEATREVLNNGEWSGELEQQTKNGRTVLVEGRWTLVRDKSGRPTSIMAINTDISERKELEAQVLRTQRIESIGTLAGGVAHDLNNILSPIVMGTDLLKRDESDERRLRLLSMLHASAQRGADLVRQVLAFSRGLDGQRGILNVREVVQAVEQIVRDTFPKNIELSIDCDRGLWPVNGNFTHLHQVLMNLLVNARDAMPEGGRLAAIGENLVLDDVYAGTHPDAHPGPYVSIRVTDTGLGIARDIREKIFDPFFTTKEVGKGTGLGLSTVLSIIKNHGGFVRVASEVGDGTAVTVCVPALANQEAVERMALGRTDLPGGNGELILVVDDEESILEITCKTLERFCYRTLTAANGAEAVALYAQRKEAIAAVFTDLAMPVMDGPATITALRSLDPNVRIIATSGLESDDCVAKAIDAGAEEFIPKPYAIHALLKTLHKVVGARA